ncbi:MAG: hypothetical protein K0S08_1198 [Gammaproteobacteria bacterium]|jgi:hypothetical protein|nr:hypothetical protein [Gammaproteobacteria bacterium]
MPQPFFTTQFIDEQEKLYQESRSLTDENTAICYHSLINFSFLDQWFRTAKELEYQPESTDIITTDIINVIAFTECITKLQDIIDGYEKATHHGIEALKPVIKIFNVIKQNCIDYVKSAYPSCYEGYKKILDEAKSTIANNRKQRLKTIACGLLCGLWTPIQWTLSCCQLLTCCRDCRTSAFCNLHGRGTDYTSHYLSRGDVAVNAPVSSIFSLARHYKAIDPDRKEEIIRAKALIHSLGRPS